MDKREKNIESIKDLAENLSKYIDIFSDVSLDDKKLNEQLKLFEESFLSVKDDLDKLDEVKKTFKEYGVEFNTANLNKALALLLLFEHKLDDERDNTFIEKPKYLNTNPCDGCPFYERLKSGEIYVGDAPCTWCSKRTPTVRFDSGFNTLLDRKQSNNSFDGFNIADTVAMLKALTGK